MDKQLEPRIDVQVKLLVTNDDGIEARGLEALRTAVSEFGEPVVVSPAHPQSGVSHAVTWHKGVRIEPKGEGRFAIHGTPADCVRLGLLHLVPEAQWVLSGINHGANLGADTWYSGTVAAVREGILHGWSGIAVSHYLTRDLTIDWPRAVRWVTPILRDLTSRKVDPGVFFNVNLPALRPNEPDPEIVWCNLDPKPLPLNYRHEETSGLYFAGDYTLRERTPGADVDLCFGGKITMTEVRLL